MRQSYNFSAGPAMLPAGVLEEIKHELPEYGNAGASIVELSHRGRYFLEIAEQLEEDLRALIQIPKNYKVLFLQGGASAQFAMVPINLLRGRNKANYVHTGHWSKKAILEAQRYCKVCVCADVGDSQHITIPDFSSWKIDVDAAYLHYTPNETISGLEFDYTPDVGQPLVADMSSTLLSRPLDVSKFGVIYACAQKNLGPSGLTVVIVRDDLIGDVLPKQPSLYDYQIHVTHKSLFNTPAVFSWYAAGKVLKCLRAQGGLVSIAKKNKQKALSLYEMIDGSSFYSNIVEKRYRSWMNVPFTLLNKKLEDLFLKESKEFGLIGLKGHRVVGGMRASLYNAMPKDGVDALIKFMKIYR